MILEKQIEANIQEEGKAQDTIGMSLDLDSAQVLMQMLSKNLYSDAIGSTIRECASNALDSHRRAGNNDPIVVSFSTTRDGNYEFSVEDFGIGLDADDVKNIISKYGKSTKRNSNTELGMMGLGFKAPLAYSSSFYFVCRKDGMERKYMMYEGDETNTIDLLYESATSERNGVKVIIPVAVYDRAEFLEKIKEQLAYFESVYFNVNGMNNNHFIMRSEHFQFSEIASDKHMHLCLDNVYYPLDFKKLGISPIDIPIGLRVSLTDGIFPTPNREAIRYTVEAVNKIKEKISKVADYFIEKYNSNVKECENFIEVYNFWKNSNRYVTLEGKGNLVINPLLSHSKMKIERPKMKGVSLLDLERLAHATEYMFGEYQMMYEFHRGKMSEVKHHYGRTLGSYTGDDYETYIYSNRISGLKKDYLRHLNNQAKLANGWGSKSFKVLKKVKSFTLFGDKNGNYDNYYKILDLEAHPKSEWRQRIQEFQLAIKSVIDTFINVDDMVVDQAFIDSRKKVRILATGDLSSGGRRKKLEGEFSCKVATNLEREVRGKNCKWVPEVFQMKDFHKNKFLMIYGSQEEAAKMDELYSIVKKYKIKFCTLSDRELKNVQKVELHNLISFSKFMEGKTTPFKKIASACYIDLLKDRDPNLFSYRNGLKGICTDLYEKIDQLHEYLQKNNPNVSDDVAKSIVEHAKEVKAFDLSIHGTCLEVEEIIEKLPFIGKMSRYANRNSWSDAKDSAMEQALVDLFKYHKHKVDLKHYKLKLDEETKLEETLTTEDVQELID